MLPYVPVESNANTCQNSKEILCAMWQCACLRLTSVWSACVFSVLRWSRVESCPVLGWVCSTMLSYMANVSLLEVRRISVKVRLQTEHLPNSSTWIEHNRNVLYFIFTIAFLRPVLWLTVKSRLPLGPFGWLISSHEPGQECEVLTVQPPQPEEIKYLSPLLSMCVTWLISTF